MPRMWHSHWVVWHEGHSSGTDVLQKQGPWKHSLTFQWQIQDSYLCPNILEGKMKPHGNAVEDFSDLAKFFITVSCYSNSQKSSEKSASWSHFRDWKRLLNPRVECLMTLSGHRRHFSLSNVSQFGPAWMCHCPVSWGNRYCGGKLFGYDQNLSSERSRLTPQHFKR